MKAKNTFYKQKWKMRATKGKTRKWGISGNLRAVRKTFEKTGGNCQSSDISELPIVRESMTGLNIRN